MRKGNGLYSRGKFDEAAQFYQQAEVLEPDATAIHFNLGNAQFRLGNYQEAARELELALVDKDPVRRANALYNLGNVAFKSGQLAPALQAYKAALLENPKDVQAKQNLEYCLKKLEEQQQPDSSQQDQQDQQDQQQQQQQPQPRPEAMDQDQAERVLQALENKEKEQQERQQQQGGRRKVEKDW
ncbi:tetratricopeptide repeat protein [candidate division WOR-3 bacterium]|nr:tetratricopeptide repeat protein [candidate division WOR-3 bacterium]